MYLHDTVRSITAPSPKAAEPGEQRKNPMELTPRLQANISPIACEFTCENYAILGGTARGTLVEAHDERRATYSETGGRALRHRL